MMYFIDAKQGQQPANIYMLKDEPIAACNFNANPNMTAALAELQGENGTVTFHGLHLHISLVQHHDLLAQA